MSATSAPRRALAGALLLACPWAILPAVAAGPVAGRASSSASGARALTAPSLDLATLAEQWAAQAPLGPQVRGGNKLLVFISLSMPEPSLHRLIRQASLGGATLVLRGLHQGSMHKTVQAWAALQSDAGAAAPLQIDPEAFERYAVTAVPAFVLDAAPAGAACAQPQCADGTGFLMASGDVSLGYALRRMALASRAPGTELQRLIRRVPE